MLGCEKHAAQPTVNIARIVVIKPTSSPDNAVLTVGWANGFIVNPTLNQYIVGLRKACSPTYGKHCRIVVIKPTSSPDNAVLTVGWANGFIVNPTLS